jgi:hypothetical protein
MYRERYAPKFDTFSTLGPVEASSTNQLCEVDERLRSTISSAMKLNSISDMVHVDGAYSLSSGGTSSSDVKAFSEK